MQMKLTIDVCQSSISFARLFVEGVAALHKVGGALIISS
jgi:hypothetical protein